MIFNLLPFYITEYAGFSNTSISGTLNTVLCSTSEESKMDIAEIQADCGGLSPEVECSCCSVCCEDDSGYCIVNLPQICENNVVWMESIMDEAQVDEARARAVDWARNCVGPTA